MSIRKTIYDKLNTPEIQAIADIYFAILPESFNVGDGNVVVYNVAAARKITDLTGDVISIDYDVIITINSTSLESIILLTDRVSTAMDEPVSEEQIEPQWDEDWGWYSATIEYSINQ
jgi:hypothetical protein